MAVVAYLHQVVNFHIVLDNRTAKGSALHRGVTANKDIIAHNDISEMREMHRLSLLVTLKSESLLP